MAEVERASSARRRLAAVARALAARAVAGVKGRPAALRGVGVVWLGCGLEAVCWAVWLMVADSVGEVGGRVKGGAARLGWTWGLAGGGGAAAATGRAAWLRRRLGEVRRLWAGKWPRWGSRTGPGGE